MFVHPVVNRIQACEENAILHSYDGERRLDDVQLLRHSFLLLLEVKERGFARKKHAAAYTRIYCDASFLSGKALTDVNCVKGCSGNVRHAAKGQDHCRIVCKTFEIEKWTKIIRSDFS